MTIKFNGSFKPLTGQISIGEDLRPAVTNDLFEGPLNEDIIGDVSLNDAETGDQPHTYAVSQHPANGTLVFNTDGTFTYTPNLDFVGTDTFKYKISDVDGDKEEATVTIDVLDPPLYDTTWYTGNTVPNSGVTNTVVTGIDSSQGVMIMTKSRTEDRDWRVMDTSLGTYTSHRIRTSFDPYSVAPRITSFNSDGFTVNDAEDVNRTGQSYLAHTFVEEPGFFDIVYFNGNQTAGHQISHNLGVTPGMVLVKRVNSLGSGFFAQLSTFGAGVALKPGYDGNWPVVSAGWWNNTPMNASTVTLGSNGDVNGNGQLAMYLFANNPAKGIVHGSYTGNGSTSGPSLNAGFEPRFIWIWMYHRFDSGPTLWNYTSPTRSMRIDSQGSEFSGVSPDNIVSTNATGFQITSSTSNVNRNGAGYHWMAIK